MNSKQLPFWIAAIYLPLEPLKFLELLEHFSDIEEFFSVSVHTLKGLGLTERTIQAIKNPCWQKVEKDLRWLEDPTHHIILISDLDYPDPLRQTSNPPILLFVNGNKKVLQEIQIAIVGSRNATLGGIKTAEQFSYLLAKMGLTITSGLAIGIDAASHRGALRAKGKTIGVAGTGLDVIYPKAHKQLFTEIKNSEGAIISEFPLLTPPQPQNFPRRNRIIAGLCTGVLIVEAALKSGSLITAKLAMEEGREVFAIPGSIHHPITKGCHSLIRQGAKLVECAADILEELKFTKLNLYDEKKFEDTPIAHLENKTKQILQEITYEVTSTDVILLRSGLTLSEVSSILLALELDGYIQSVPGGYIRS